MDADLEARLRNLLDRDEIWSVLLRYARGLDRLDRDLVRSCYHDDAVDDHHSFVGSAEGFIDWAFADGERTTTVYHHGINNHTCEVVGDDAYSETYYTYFGGNVAKPDLASIGRYIDHFQRRSGVWKIANRVCVIERLFELHEVPSGTPTNAGAGVGTPAPATRDRGDVSYQRPVRPRHPLPTAG